MKLNNKGWGLTDLIIWISVILMVFVIILVLINVSLKKVIEGDTVENPETSEEIKRNIDNTTNTERKNVYQELEDKVFIATGKYLEKYPEYRENIITTNTLKGEGLLEKFSNDNIECSGYVKLEQGEENTYGVYIKCGSEYETIGYNSSLDYTNKDLSE